MARTQAEPMFVFDVARAGGAVLVLLSHARSLTLVDADEMNLGWTGRFVYGVTGLGHQAVIVFFVASGFLVTRSILQRAAEGRWSISRFAIDRLTRLWIVLLPCLAIGALCDRAGLWLGGPEIDPARYGALALIAPRAPALDVATLIGNAVFLQTILVPPYGSNGALWSLANEAWYYAAAGLAFALWRARIPSIQRVLGWCALLGAFLLLPRAIVDLAPLWLFGAGLAFVSQRAAFEPSPWARAISILGLFACLLAARLRLGGHPLVLDYALGLAIAAVLGLHLSWHGRSAVVRFIHPIARLSYSLYLSHSPVLAFAATLTLHQNKLPYSLEGLGLLAAELVLAGAVATVVWWCFERHTAALRHWLSRPVIRVRPRPTREGAVL